MTRVVLGVSGASGAALALATARHLRGLGAEIDLVVSAAAKRTLLMECGKGAMEDVAGMATHTHKPTDIGARIASGSHPVAGMIVAPCSMRSLAAIANGLDDSLLTRAASVQLKERRPLILLTREADPCASAQHDCGDRDGGYRFATSARVLPAAGQSGSGGGSDRRTRG